MLHSKKSIAFQILMITCTTFCALDWVAAQVTTELPKVEYYVARKLFDSGRSLEAQDGFQVALDRARRIGDKRWVDSIPPLVMLGESHYQQGALAQSLEYYDAALMLFIEQADFLSQLELPPEQPPLVEGLAKGIAWFPKSANNITYVVIPESYQIAIDTTAAQPAPGGGVVAPVSLVTRLDATEIIRTVGVALWRRHEILGPLATHSPLNAPLEQLFGRQPRQTWPWIVSSWNALRGLAGISSATAANPTDALYSGLHISRTHDYFLTPLVLHALGSLDMRAGNYPAAITKFQDATLLAAQFEQDALLAETTLRLCSCACASQRVELIPNLQNLINWSAKRSGLVQTSALAGMGELAVYAGNVILADATRKQCHSLLNSRGVNLPKVEAQNLFVAAMVEFQRQHRNIGMEFLQEALQLTRGNSQTGIANIRAYQSQLTLDLLAGGALNLPNAESILDQVLAEPTPIEWQNQPLDFLTHQSTSTIVAYNRWLEMAILRGDQAEIATRFDRVQRQRLYETLPLGGRTFVWRLALEQPVAQLPNQTRNSVNIAVQRQPALEELPRRIRQLKATLKQGPLPLDDRQIIGDQRRTFEDLVSASQEFENQLAIRSISRLSLDREFPSPANLGQLQSNLSEGELLIGFVDAGSRAVGIAISSETQFVWQIDSLPQIVQVHRSLLQSISGIRSVPPVLPSQVVAPDARWHSIASELGALLFPQAVQELILKSQQVVFCPSGPFWYLPFELLPESQAKGAASLLTNHHLVYVPTLGSFSFAHREPSTLEHRMAVVGNFYAPDRNLNQQLAAQVDSQQQTALVFLNQKNNLGSSLWLRTCLDQLLVASELPVVAEGVGVQLLPSDNVPTSRLASWLESPLSTPKHVLLPGMRTSAIAETLGSGDELLLTATTLMYSGCEACLLSRWPVGGVSTSRLLKRYLDERLFSSDAEAWQHSVLALWAEPLSVAEEPAMLPAGAENESLTNGEHPLLWAGYFIVGNTDATVGR
ncbi:MAG: CHAT domain-containing protein [Planctomycetales bacterium]|nr:CHAT domain-containing protein [Planctomycetales bacterium]